LATGEIAMQKMALFAFRGELSCFVHVLLNAIDMREKGDEVKIVLEGEATRLVAELAKPDNHLHALFEKTKGLGLIAGVCRACSHQLGSQEAAVAEGFALLDDMHGHPGMARYMDEGFTVLIF
jgi:hypothetical protein